MDMKSIVLEDIMGIGPGYHGNIMRIQFDILYVYMYILSINNMNLVCQKCAQIYGKGSSERIMFRPDLCGSPLKGMPKTLVKVEFLKAVTQM